MCYYFKIKNIYFLLFIYLNLYSSTIINYLKPYFCSHDVRIFVDVHNIFIFTTRTISPLRLILCWMSFVILVLVCLNAFFGVGDASFILMVYLFCFMFCSAISSSRYPSPFAIPPLRTRSYLLMQLQKLYLTQ